MKQPPHKTAHSQALTHEPMLQLAKELFFFAYAPKKIQHYDIDWLTWNLLLKIQG
jgi:hypothetical protein